MRICFLILLLPTLFAAETPIQPAKLAKELPAITITAGVPGITVGLIEKGKAQTPIASGFRDAESKDQMMPHVIFEAASLSKPVFAYLCMRLVDKGILELDKPLLPILDNDRIHGDPRAQKITARMILSHRTGLPNWGGDTLSLAFDPGSDFRYSGEGYVYLGQVLEKLSGKTLEVLFAQEVFHPLGMTYSKFTWDRRFKDRMSAAHNHLGQVEDGRQRNQEVNTAASLYTNVMDYQRFTIAIMEGEGLKPDSHQAMLKSQGKARFNQDQPDGSGAPIQWALGWGFIPNKDQPIYWHWGDNGSFKSFVIWRAKERDGMIYFTNSSEGHTLLGALVGKLDTKAAKAMEVLGYESFDTPGRRERLAAEALIDKGQYAQAMQLLDFGLKKNPDIEILKTMRQWAEDLQLATGRPLPLTQDHLQSLAGTYGPRKLMAGPGQLFYRRDGRDLYPLIAINKYLYALDGYFPFRLEVVVNEKGEPEKIIGHYLNGNTDESPRTQPAGKR